MLDRQASLPIRSQATVRFWVECEKLKTPSKNNGQVRYTSGKPPVTTAIPTPHRESRTLSVFCLFLVDCCSSKYTTMFTDLQNVRKLKFLAMVCHKRERHGESEYTYPITAFADCFFQLPFFSHKHGVLKEAKKPLR